MRIRPGLIYPVLCLAVLAGCGDSGSEGSSADVEGEPAGELIRGMYAFGHEVRALRPCGEEDDLWVMEPTGILQTAHGMLVGSQADKPRVFVLATGRTGPAPDEGFGADYPGAVAIDEVLYVALEGFRCDFDVTRFIYRASGNEPFWMVEVLEDGMTLSRPGEPKITWPAVTREISGARQVFTGSGGDMAGKLTIIPGPGYDSMSGAYHGNISEFELDGEIFNGVALRGFAGKSGQED